MKKTLCMILSVIMVLSLFAGCGKTAEEPAPAAAPAAETPAETPAESSNPFEGQTLKVAAFEGGFGVQYWENICNAFEEAYGVTVELTTSPTIDDIIRPQMIAGEYPDIMFVNTGNSALYKEMLSEHAFMDLAEVFAGPALDKDCTLGELIADGLFETTAFNPYHDGQVIRAPVSSNGLGLVYNKALFEENGWTFPTTWDEFFALGDAAKEKGLVLFTYPGIYPDYCSTFLYGALAGALGVDALLQLEDYDASCLETEEAKQIFADMAKAISPDYLMPGTVGLNHTQSQAEFMLNKALIIPNGDWMPSEMADAPLADGFVWAAAPALTLSADQTNYYQLICDGFEVPNAAANKELAKEFIRFFYTDEAQRFMCEAGITCCTKNFMEVAGDLLPAEKKAFLEMRNSAAAFSVSYAAVDTKLNVIDVLFYNMTSVANGEKDAEAWRLDCIDTFKRIAAGE